MKSWWQRGFAVGVAAHGIGTSRAFSVHPEAGTYASLGMGLHGVLGAVLIRSRFMFLGSRASRSRRHQRRRKFFRAPRTFRERRVSNWPLFGTGVGGDGKSGLEDIVVTTRSGEDSPVPSLSRGL